MEQMIGKHGQNWMGPTKLRNDINLYLGLMYYISGFGSSLWMAEAVWMQFKDTSFAPNCMSTMQDKEASGSFCLSSWRIFVHGHTDEAGVPDRIRSPQFAFIKVVVPLTLLMSILLIMARRYWLIAEEGRVNIFVSEFRDKILPQMDEEAADQKKLQNIRADRIAYVTRAIIEFKGDQWYFRRYFMANLLTGLILVGQLWYLHFVLGWFNLLIIYILKFMLTINIKNQNKKGHLNNSLPFMAIFLPPPP